jgi:tetratricopeptide (TPR) repeat protein
VGLYEEELKKLLEPSRQIEMLLRAARVYEEELGELHKAIAALRRILDVDPDERTAILSLDRLYQATQRWPELAEILRREIRLAQSDEEIIALLFRQGQLQESELKDIDAALASYREILASDPNHGPTLAALELLFADQVKQVEIAAILEPLYSASEQWEKLIRVHEVQLSRLEDGDERQTLLQRIAEIWEQRLSEPRAAFEAWTRALREAPLRDLPGWEVERLAAVAGAWNEVVTLYDQILAENQDVETRRRVLLKLARVWVSELQDAARAEETYLRVLELDPKDADALAALDQLYEGSGMWSELADILARRIGITSVTDDMIELQFRVGRIYEEELGNSEKAVAAYHAILELEPRNARALESLERVFFQREQWAELYGVYEKMIDIAQGDADMAECYARMAKIAAEALGDRARAIDLWNRVVDYRGEDSVALDHLASLYEQAQSWPELVEVIERRIRLSGNVDEQIRLYSFLGRVWYWRSMLHIWMRCAP